MPKISVIIPVYNVEKYLSQCLDSVINQTFKDFECICVNDGSTDNSLTILQEYSNKDNRIKIINQKNSGSSIARNKALRQSIGQYIAFIDSDDFVSNDYLEKLITVAEKENSDIVYCRHKMYYPLDNRYENGPNREKLIKLFFEYSKSKGENKQIKYILDIVENSRSICMKLYKSEVIKNNNIYFFENIFAEMDYSFNILINLYSRKISLLDEELYYYRKQISSITSKKKTFRINAINSFICLTKEMEKRNLLKNNEILKKFILSHFTFNIGKKIPKESQQEVFSVAYNHFFYLKKILEDSFISVCKINIYIFIMKIFKTKSFIFFRMLKNF
jgi:glycosyltransferase involved in cell wall biosynthesis